VNHANASYQTRYHSVGRVVRLRGPHLSQTALEERLAALTVMRPVRVRSASDTIKYYDKTYPIHKPS